MKIDISTTRLFRYILKMETAILREIFRQNFEVKNVFNPFSANFTKWLNKLKQFVGNLPKNWLSVFDHFVGLALKRLNLREKHID